MLLYDPPFGWKYGFPKPYQPLENEILIKTLLRDGYPQHEIDSLKDHLYVRFTGDSRLSIYRSHHDAHSVYR